MSRVVRMGRALAFVMGSLFAVRARGEGAGEGREAGEEARSTGIQDGA
jgi:hypothetical protein